MMPPRINIAVAQRLLHTTGLTDIKVLYAAKQSWV
jgi:hypothetical protein